MQKSSDWDLAASIGLDILSFAAEVSDDIPFSYSRANALECEHVITLLFRIMRYWWKIINWGAKQEN